MGNNYTLGDDLIIEKDASNRNNSEMPNQDNKIPTQSQNNQQQESDPPKQTQQTEETDKTQVDTKDEEKEKEKETPKDNNTEEEKEKPKDNNIEEEKNNNTSQKKTKHTQVFEIQKETKKETTQTQPTQKTNNQSLKRTLIIMNDLISISEDESIGSSFLNTMNAGNEFSFSKSILPNSFEQFVKLCKQKNCYDNNFIYISSKNKTYKFYSEETYNILKTEVSLDPSIDELTLHIEPKSNFLKKPKTDSNSKPSLNTPEQTDKDQAIKNEINKEIDILINKYKMLQSNMIESKNSLIESMKKSLINEVLFTKEKMKDFQSDILYEQLSNDLIIIPTPPSRLNEYFGNDLDNPHKCHKCGCDNKPDMLYCSKCDVYFCTDCTARFKGLEHTHQLFYKPKKTEQENEENEE